jgi:Electron transfer DM13
MQRQNLLLTALIATIAIGVSALTDGNLRAVNAELPMPVSITVASKIAAASVLASGNFKKSEHPTSGTAQIVIQNGKKYLKFDSSFQSDSGPDLFVILHRQDSPKSYGKSDYVSLGRLKKTSGQQMYAIPNGVNIAKFKSVVIWCKKFNATFGFAPLG